MCARRQQPAGRFRFTVKSRTRCDAALIHSHAAALVKGFRATGAARLNTLNATGLPGNTPTWIPDFPQTTIRTSDAASSALHATQTTWLLCGCDFLTRDIWAEYERKHMMKCHSLLALTTLVLFGASSSQAGDNSQTHWVKYGILFFNLDTLLKIEIDGDHVRFVRQDNTPLADDSKVDSDQLQNLRAAVDASENWVRVSNDRKENQEWYVNLDHVPLVMSAEIQGIWGTSLNWSQDKKIGISPSNETSKKIMEYLSRRLVK
jgi:hypothetical protein